MLKSFCCLVVFLWNVSRAANHHIRVISEWSCDTEDWSNDAKKIQNQLRSQE